MAVWFRALDNMLDATQHHGLGWGGVSFRALDNMLDATQHHALDIVLGQVVVGTERVPAKDTGSENKIRRPFLFIPVVPWLCFFMGVEAKPYVPRTRGFPQQTPETSVRAKNCRQIWRTEGFATAFHSTSFGSKNQVVLGTLIWGFLILNYNGNWHSILIPHSSGAIKMLMLKIAFLLPRNTYFYKPSIFHGQKTTRPSTRRAPSSYSYTSKA